MTISSLVGFASLVSAVSLLTESGSPKKAELPSLAPLAGRSIVETLTDVEVNVDKFLVKDSTGKVDRDLSNDAFNAYLDSLDTRSGDAALLKDWVVKNAWNIVAEKTPINKEVQRVNLDELTSTLAFKALESVGAAGNTTSFSEIKELFKAVIAAHSKVNPKAEGSKSEKEHVPTGEVLFHWTPKGRSSGVTLLMYMPVPAAKLNS